MKMESIKPANAYVLGEVVKFDTVEDGVYVGESSKGTKQNVEYYYATALELGSDATAEDQCPGLKKGDGIIFSQFAGYHVDTGDTFCKLVRGHEIVAITSNLADMNEKTVKPTGDRVLVKIVEEDVIQDGIYDPTASDPREADVQKGTIVSCGPKATKFKVGALVAFDPFCGNMVVNDEKTKLKTVNSFDILFSVE